MSNPQPQPAPNPAVALVRPRRVWDIVLTIVLLVMAFIIGFIALFGELFITAFTDSCPPKTCNLNAAVGSLGITWLVVALVLIACTVLAIIRITRRRLAWWVALIAVFAVVVGSVVGYILYSYFVGYT